LLDEQFIGWCDKLGLHGSYSGMAARWINHHSWRW
jgi:hypothetical protein